MRRLGLISTIGALLSSLLITSIFLVSPGFAADPQRRGKVAAEQSDDYLAPAPAAKSWTGLYLSAGLAVITTGELDSFEIGENTVCRLGGGYDHQIAGTRIVVGILGDWTLPCGRNNGEFELNGAWYGGVRLGALLSDHWLGYGTLGYTAADLVDFSSSEGRGMTPGLGTELMITKHISLKVDWRRVNFDKIELRQDEITGFINFRF